MLELVEQTSERLLGLLDTLNASYVMMQRERAAASPRIVLLPLAGGRLSGLVVHRRSCQSDVFAARF